MQNKHTNKQAHQGNAI